MFTGLIEECGEVLALELANQGARLRLQAPTIASDTRLGDSIAVNGCCLTVSSLSENELSFDLLGETLERTSFKHLTTGSRVNLERALAANGRLGGHFVQGHVDCAAEVLSFSARGADHRLEIALPKAFAQYVVFKGSIAIDGISLTVAEVLPQSFVLWIIPHTLAATNLGACQPGLTVNLEFDLLAKYLERLLQARA